MPRRVRGLLAVMAATGLAVAGAPRAAIAAPAPDPDSGRSAVSVSWRLSPTGSSARLRGLSAVSGTVVWASGTGGTVMRTTDGGASWASVGPPDTVALQFRDVEATSDRHAVVLSSGGGSDSRIYVTDDGGASWTRAFQNSDPQAFYDCLAFSTPQRGLALSDPVDGGFRLLETSDGGHTWSLVDPSGMPPAGPTEFAFAASGSCLTSGQDQPTYLGSGGETGARIFVSQDRGHTWSVAPSNLDAGPSAGVFSVRFRDSHNGIAVGGDYGNPNGALGNSSWTSDGGLTWYPSAVFPTGYRSGAAWLPQQRDVAIAVGPSGSDVTSDAGRTWSTFDDGSFDSVECANDGACWASGDLGRVARLVLPG